MKRWQKVTIWVASILIVLVVGGLFAANYAVDKVLDSMVGMSVDELLEEENSDVAEGDELTDDSSITDGTDIVTPEYQAAQDNTNDSDNQAERTEGGVNSTEPTAPNSTDKQQTPSENPPATEKPAPSTKPETDKSSGGYSAEISTDKAKEVEDSISVAEKAKVVTTLMSSLSASEISTLQKLASGGLSVEEKKEARDLMLEKLSEDQYNELIKIAAKHGLSQGKSYSEVKEE